MYDACIIPFSLPLFLPSFCNNRTLMEGDEKAGFSIFWADDGLDTGPLLLQKETKLEMSDTVDTIYSRFLYPEGIRAMVSSFQRLRGQRSRGWGCYETSKKKKEDVSV